MKYLYQLNKILSKQQKRTIIFLTVLSFVVMTLEILTLNFMLIFLTYMSEPSSLESSKFFIYLKKINIGYNLNVFIFLIFICSFFLKNIFTIFVNWKEIKFIHLSRAYLSKLFFNGYLYLPRIFHLRSNTSHLIKNITVETELVMTSVQALQVLVMEIVVLLGVCIFLMFVNFKLTIYSFLLLTIFSILVNFFNQKKIIKLGKDRSKLVQLRLKSIMEGLTGSKMFELTGTQKKVLDEFNQYTSQYAMVQYNVSFRSTLPRPLFELFILFVIGSVLIISFDSMSGIKSTIPTIGVFIAAAYRLIPSFARIIENVQKFQFNIQVAEKLSRDIDKFENNKSSNIDTDVNVIFKDSIKFENVSFSYYKNTKVDSNFVFKDLNMEIKKGSKIGIVGISGSGKSTFLDLFMGLISPQNGKIFVDGKNVKNIKKGWQKIFGCVPQDVFILDNTLKRNVAFGLPDINIDDKKVNKAIELANLEDFTKNSKFGLETLLGESGSRLSGGQRQRIGIARALYNEPDILILDEATNALDTETESKIIKEIFQSKEKRTIIYVSHNEKNLSFCDSIYETKNKSFHKIK